MRECLTHVREAMTEESKGYPDMPLSYAVGYALASDFRAARCGSFSVLPIKICISTKTM